MNALKRQSAGFYLTALTFIFAVLGLVLYLINCKTAYFTNQGIHAGIVVCLLAAAVLELVMIIGSNIKGPKNYFDLIPVICGILLIIALVIIISVRVNSIATILSFERNDQTMSDLSSAIAAMGFSLAAVIINIAAAFCKIVKTDIA